MQMIIFADVWNCHLVLTHWWALHLRLATARDIGQWRRSARKTDGYFFRISECKTTRGSSIAEKAPCIRARVRVWMGSRNRPWTKISIQNPTLTLTLIRTWIWTPTHTQTRVRIWTSTRTRPWLGSEPGLGIRTAHQSKHHVNAIVPKSAFSLLCRLIMCNSPHLRRPCSNRSPSKCRLRRVCCCGTDGGTETDRRTDARQMHRPCSACYAGTGSANKMDFT